MKIIFRLNYHTHPGQSIWLKLATTPRGTSSRIEQTVPMRWRDDRHWEAELQFNSTDPLEIEYAYQMRQDWNGVVIDEWDGMRTALADPGKQDALVLLDTWRSAGTIDYALETKAFCNMLPARGDFTRPSTPSGANHTFLLRMAAVPAGLAPCLLGSVSELGDWDHAKAVPLMEVAPNVWCASMSLPSDWHIEYKYALRNTRSGSIVSVENGENRTLSQRAYSGSQWTIVADEAYRRSHEQLPRGAGVAIPVFSLRTADSLGIGEFADLIPFADWAHDAGFQLIQILPINDTTSAHDWTDSYPYSAISVFALHPIYLRIDDLPYPMGSDFHQEIQRLRGTLNPLEKIDHEAVAKAKIALTRRIFDKHGKAITTDEDFRNYLGENRDWIIPYAAFCVLRDKFGTAKFDQWKDWAEYDADRVAALARPDSPEWPALAYHIWLQYELDRQLEKAVVHLHTRGIALKGDLPIGIDRQSVEAWSAPHLFHMHAQAGAPPDPFAVKGQNWGFPTYNWDAMRDDGYAWWRARFEKLSRYFDAYRIDHILGFFRIWQIDWQHVEGILGVFDPAMPIHVDEIRGRGIPFDFNRFCKPYIREHFLGERFGEFAHEARQNYLEPCGHGYYRLRDHVATQRAIEEHFATWKVGDAATEAKRDRLYWGLLDCASDVVLLEVPGSHGSQFHPRFSMQATKSFQELDGDTRRRMEDLYVDYFYRRQESFWQARGYEKLPAMRKASNMLLCGEDLGVVPACVPGVMQNLGILSLEIQRMPKSSSVQFFHPADAPYMSVVSPSTHDMPTLRGWWREDANTTASYAWQMFGIAFPPHELSTDIATRILDQHLYSPAMWAIFPLQDLLAIDEKLRHPDPDAERINVPAICPYYWRYRMHLDIEELRNASAFNNRLREMLKDSSRIIG